MKTMEHIAKKVNPIPNLKYFFAASSHEFNTMVFEKKIQFFHRLIQNGFSVYDLSENFRRRHEAAYTDEDLKKVIIYYISMLLYNQPLDLRVTHYFKEDSHHSLANYLDKLIREQA
jgi:hypothetical protein